MRVSRSISIDSAPKNANGEGTPSGDQGNDDAYAKHSKNDTAEEDRVFWRGLIHDGRKDTGCQYTENHASCRSNGEQRESMSQRCAEHLALTGSKGYADTEFAEPFAEGIRGHAEDAGNGQHRAQQAKRRRGLLWFTSGSNMLLGSDPMSITMDPGARRAIYDLLESERIAIYPIDARGLTVVFGRAAMATALQQMQMRQDAAATGGAAYVNTNGLTQATQHILATDGNYYTLSYTPNDLKSNSKWHRVEMKLVNAHYDLSYRHGYFDDGSNRPQPAKVTRTRTALRAGGNKLEVPDDRSEPIVFSVRIAPASPVADSLPGDSPQKKGETRYVVEYDRPDRNRECGRGRQEAHKVAGSVRSVRGVETWTHDDFAGPIRVGECFGDFPLNNKSGHHWARFQGVPTKPQIPGVSTLLAMSCSGSSVASTAVPLNTSRFDFWATVIPEARSCSRN
jgi:hypothetical protein